MRSIIASGDLPMSAGRYIGRSSAEHFSTNPRTSKKTRRRILEKNAIAPANVCKRKLRNAATAVFVFLAAATGTGFIAADFRTTATDRQVEFHFASTVTTPPCHCHCGLRLRNRPRRARSSGRSVFFQQKLRKCGQEILEGLEVRSATE